MEESFTTHDTANSTAANSSNDENALELQQWRQWREAEPARLYTNNNVDGAGSGSADQPIEIDGGGDDGSSADDAANGASSTVRAREHGAEGAETLWGHAVHARELQKGDQVRAMRKNVSVWFTVTQVHCYRSYAGVSTCVDGWLFDRNDDCSCAVSLNCDSLVSTPFKRGAAF